MKRWVWGFLLSVLIILSGCMSAEDKELSDLVDKMKEDLEEETEVDVYINEFGELVLDDQPEKAMEVLKEKVIPGYEELIGEYKELDLKGEDAIEMNKIVVRLLQADLDTQIVLSEIFDDIKEKAANGKPDEIDIDANLQALSDINKEIVVVVQDYYDKIIYLTETYDFLETEGNIEDTFLDLDVTQMDEDNESLIAIFFEVVVGKSSSDLIEDDEEIEIDSEESKSNNDAEMLLDQGNPYVVFDATATIEDHVLHVAGLSNLLEGSTVYFDVYHFGSDNPYLKDKAVVDENGAFDLMAEVDPDSLNGDPLTLRLSYQPDKESEEAQAIYGEEGEHIEGPFKHKFASIKRTRHGAFTYAQIEFKEGVEQKFNTITWDEPSDYGDLNIWMEKDSVDTHDAYYDITMKSNLIELTWIKASIEVPGYDVAGYTSRANVMPDGSFRFQIPRPDVDSEEVIVIIEATSDAAIETEELYGEHGEKFAGDLTEKTNRGQKIVYELLLGEDR